MPKPLPRKLDFICTLAETPKNPATTAAVLFGVAAAVALVASAFVEQTSFFLLGVLRVSAAVLTAGAVLAFSRATSSFDARSKIQLEVGLDGLRLPLQTISFRQLASVNVETTTSSYSTLELLLTEGEPVRLSMLDAEPVARLIRERHELFKRLTAPRARPRADGYRGVRIAEEAESIESGLRQEWADADLDVLLRTALVIPEQAR